MSKEAEKHLEDNYGITFTRTGNKFHNEIAEDWLNSMESYHQSRVDAITDDMFENYFFDETKVNPSLIDGAIRGYKWLKQKLKNKP
ncbi:MAG: hypothetical protein KDC67_16625 [Ignavibacteriae bacterium]|nr:hypothetical protein [Ignavibacteriota bacterium]